VSLFGVEPDALADMRSLCERTPGLERVWIFGSRTRKDWRPRSDIDLAVDAPTWTRRDFGAFEDAIRQLPMVYKLDMVLWQSVTTPVFKEQIERDRKIFWEPRRHTVKAQSLGGTQLKAFQSTVLEHLATYLTELKKQQALARNASHALAAMEGMEDLMRAAADFPKKAWSVLNAQGSLPTKFAQQPHSSRFDGAGRAIPNVCLKVPTGGGKTLLAAASVGLVFSSYLNRHSGLVLWIVPNEAIYRQTLKTLANRDHPYRQMLNVAGAGRVKILEKDSPLTRLDVDSHLCVMLLMLQSAARKDEAQRKLKAFRDRGNVLGFVPREDDIDAHWQLLGQVPNLDAYAPWGASQAEVRATKGSIVKSSLGNVLRLVQPLVVIDEGHHAYSENALRTLDGFNPSFMLELSATPRVSSDKGSGSNILVDVRGTDLDEAEMIKLPINVDMRGWSDWQSCLASSVEQLNALQLEATELQAQSNRYIRPILLVQVERTGKDLRDSGFIHAEDAKDYLLQLGFSEAQIAIKTSDKDELKAPENLDLLSPTCEVRVIITKQALQEGWDCPFAYVLCALAAGRELRAMTQLVGRILRLPQVAKTGRAALDACYVLCHNAVTGEVVKAIKASLEGEGMGDLAVKVNGSSPDPDLPRPVSLKRRPEFAKLHLFMPKVTWAQAGQERRELCYESDVLASIDWSGLDLSRLAADWVPGAAVPTAVHLELNLSILDDEQAAQKREMVVADSPMDRTRMVRALLDVAPNPWLVWAWLDVVLARLLARYDARAIAASCDTLIEQLRLDLQKERDRLAQAVFEDLVKKGMIQFRLRSDRCDYQLPQEFTLQQTGKPRKLTRSDGFSDIEKSLLAPALQSPDMNEFEAAFAGYLDEQKALQWWHRNVAKTQYGLQGWKQHKVYPDFVFGFLTEGNQSRVVLLETKGAQLAGNHDTGYKQALLAQLTQAFYDERLLVAGGLELEEGGLTTVECDLVFDPAWRSTMDQRYFGEQNNCKTWIAALRSQ